MAGQRGITVEELIDSQLLRFLPEVENQWAQAKRDEVADAYEKADEQKKVQFDALVDDVKAAQEAKVAPSDVVDPLTP